MDTIITGKIEDFPPGYLFTEEEYEKIFSTSVNLDFLLTVDHPLLKLIDTSDERVVNVILKYINSPTALFQDFVKDLSVSEEQYSDTVYKLKQYVVDVPLVEAELAAPVDKIKLEDEFSKNYKK